MKRVFSVKGSTKFFFTGQTVNILGSMGHMVSVAITEFIHS